MPFLSSLNLLTVNKEMKKNLAHCDEKRYNKLTSATCCVFVSLWNDSGLFWDPVTLSFGGSLKELMKVVTVCYIKPRLFVIILFLYIHTYIYAFIQSI